MRRALPVLTLAAAACAPADLAPQAGISIAEASAVTRAAAEQVKRCYRMPRLPSAARRIAVRLLVRLAPDGTLLEPPLLVRQEGVTSGNQLYAAVMAQAAQAAVSSCAPLRLPRILYRGGWDEFYLDFTPRALV